MGDGMTTTRFFFILTVLAWIGALLYTILGGNDPGMRALTLGVAVGLTCMTIVFEDMGK